MVRVFLTELPFEAHLSGFLFVASLDALLQRTFGVNKNISERMKIAGRSESEHGDSSTQTAVLTVCHTLRAVTGWWENGVPYSWGNRDVLTSEQTVKTPDFYCLVLLGHAIF